MKKKRSKFRKILKLIILCIIAFIAYIAISTYTKTYDMSSISFSSETVEYDKLKHSIKIDGDLPDGVSVSYTYNGETRGGETNAGEYIVVASFEGDSRYKAIDDMTATLTIEAISITDVLSFSDSRATYDGTEHSIEVDGNIPDGVSVSYKYDGEDITGETEPGKYTVDAIITNTSSNYSEASLTLEATFIISKAELDLDGVTFDDDSVEYDGYSHSITASDIPDGVSVSYTYNKEEVSSVIDAGTYTVRAIFKEENYITKTLTATLEITNVTDYSYTIDSDSVILSTYTGSSTKVNVPKAVLIDNTVYSVVGLDDECFEDNINIISVIIPDSVISIGDSCFLGCTNLESVEIDNATSLGNRSFYECENLESIEIPSSVETIGYECFTLCASLESVTFETTSDLKTIGYSCFFKCYDLTSIEIPSSVTSIGSQTFEYCTRLKSVTFDSDTNITSISNSCFYRCYDLKSIEIPSSVTSLGIKSFYYCYSLTSIEIPSAVESIGTNCFYECTELDEIIFDDASTWYVSKTKGEEDIAVNVTNSENNTSYLKTKYNSYYWTKE